MHSQYCLNQATLSVTVSESSRREFVYIPAGTVISVSGPVEGKLVEVTWEGHAALVFSEDIQERADQIFDPQETMQQDRSDGFRAQ